MQIQGYTLFMGNRTKDKKTSVWNNNTQQTQSDKTEQDVYKRQLLLSVF